MMHNSTGKFFHIDFGHFLGHCKVKAGFTRDREPFIYSDELNYFLVHFGELLVQEVQDTKTTEAAAKIKKVPTTLTTEPSELTLSKRTSRYA
jgi:hypothetical protein